MKTIKYVLIVAGAVCSQAMDSLNLVVVHGQRLAIPKQNAMQDVQILNRDDLLALAPVTTAEALRLSGLATVQTSQVGGGSPILRGFEANRVMLVVDGVRMNNAIYRGGHLQSLITVDPHTLQSIKVLSGPSSVSYGSDALGGVVVMNTLMPKFQIQGKSYLLPSASIRYGSAAQEKTYQALIQAGFAEIPLGLLSSITYTDRGDLRTGSWHPDGQYSWGADSWNIKTTHNFKDSVVASSNPLVQSPSGYHQLDLLEKLRWSPSARSELDLNFQYSTSGDIPRYDRLTELDSKGLPVYAQWYYGPQNRMLTSLGFKYNPLDLGLFDQSEILLSWQSLGESRMSRKLNKPMLKHQVEDVQAYRFNWDLAKSLSQNVLRYGIDLGYDDVNSKAWQDSIYNGMVGAQVDTRYPQNGSSIVQAGAYMGDLWTLSPSLQMDLSLRYQWQMLQADFGEKTVLKLPFRYVKTQAGALTGAGSLNWEIYPGLKIGALANTGFRSPNVDDLGKVFDSQFDLKKGTATLIVPNENLKPEYAWSGESYLQFQPSVILNVELRTHRTYLQDALALAPTTLLGDSLVDYEGIQTRPFSYQNLSQALIWGWSANGKSQLGRLEISGGAQQSFGTLDDGSSAPMDHIAPLSWNVSGLWKTRAIDVQINALGAGAKLKKDYNLLGEDNFAYATPSGLPAWWILNSRLGLKWKDQARIDLGVENLFDHYYRTFASGSGAPGRNWVVQVHYGI